MMALESHSKDKIGAPNYTVPPITISMDKNNTKTAGLPDADHPQSTLPINKTYENSKKCKYKLACLSAMIFLILCCVIAGLEVFRIVQSSDLRSEVDKLKGQQAEFDQLKSHMKDLQKRIKHLEESTESSLLREEHYDTASEEDESDDFDAEEYDDEDSDNDEEILREFEKVRDYQASDNNKSTATDQEKLVIDKAYSDNVRNTRSTTLGENTLAFTSQAKSSSEIRNGFPKKWPKNDKKFAEIHETDDLNLPSHKRHHHRTQNHVKGKASNGYIKSQDPITPLRSMKGHDEGNTQIADSEVRLFSNGNVQHRHQAKSRRRVLQPMHKSLSPSRAVRSSPHQGRFKLVAVHYKGDSTRYNSTNFNEYEGNFKIRHPSGVYHYWLQSNWLDNFSPDNHFTLERGVVTVKEHGLYYIYAQIYYHDDHDTNGYVIELNESPLFQCTTTTLSAERYTKSNTCHTSGITYLNANDRIHIKDLGSRRYALFKEEQSFFGLVRLGDLRATTTGP